MPKKDQKAAVAEVIASAAAAAAPAPVEQLELMPATRFEPGSDRHDKLVEAVRANKRGRPPGAENVATREMKAFVLKVFGDPLLWRFRYLQHTPETLARELNCTMLEAYDRLDRLAADLSKLFYGQMAQVDSAGQAVAPRLTMVFTGQSASASGPDGSARAPWLYIEQTQENQALSAPEQSVSHGDVSHGDD
ncbi:hypothetical protein [Bradyrhizobium sp.]|uniref:hypothetical protein n=1 Tax=Bradyrhizobium sp. TaxID=376 RepID=UPI0039E536ED